MPKDEPALARVTDATPRPYRARLPGLWQASGVVLLSTLVCGYWALGGWERPGAGLPSTASGVSGIAEVSQDDMADALGTVEGTPDQLARFRAQEACNRHMAVLTVARAPGRPPGRIRLQSGGYVSPAFELADTPVRVALPFPAPYAAGRGTLSVLGTTTDAVVALSPPWQVPARPGLHTVQVTWSPAGACPASSGS